MKGCGDKAWAQVHKIQKAGPKRVIEYVRNNTGVQDPVRDMEIIRTTAVGGYEAAARKHGLSSARGRDILERYSAMAELILAGAPVEPPRKPAPVVKPRMLAAALRRCGQGGDKCNSGCPYWELHCADGDCVGQLMADAARELSRLREALDEICVHLDAGGAIVDWTGNRLEPAGMPEINIPGSDRQYVVLKNVK